MVRLGREGDHPRLLRFAERFLRRELPKRVLVLPVYLNSDVQGELLRRYFQPGSPDERFAWEAEMERHARAAFGREIDVLMYCPERTMQLKEARTLVRLPGNGPLWGHAKAGSRSENVRKNRLFQPQQAPGPRAGPRASGARPGGRCYSAS